MNTDRSKKNSRKTAPKCLALVMLALASIGATGCEHPLSTMFNQQGETARAAMEQQTVLMEQILADQREREDAALQREQDLIARLDEQDAEDEFGDDECFEETGEPCPEDAEDVIDDEDSVDVCLDEPCEEDGGGLNIEEDSLTD